MISSFSSGDLVKVKRQPIGFSEKMNVSGIIISIRQRYWDYGDGECGYVDVAEVMTDKEVFEVATAFLVPF